jgi:ribonuclease III
MSDALTRFQERLNYQFSDVGLLRHALKHRSAGAQHNERLEFLGDSLVNLFAAESLYHSHPEASEGDLSSMRSHLVRKESLAKIARFLHFEEVIELGQSALSSGGHRRDSILADTVEAVIAATYLDGGWQSASEVVAKMMAIPALEISSVESVRDAKSLLQEKLQGQGYATPTYETLSVDGPGHARKFSVSCIINGFEQVFEGQGPNRRAAEQMAANVALETIEKTQAKAEINNE